MSGKTFQDSCALAVSRVDWSPYWRDLKAHAFVVSLTGVRLLQSARNSGSWFLATFVVGVVLSRLAGYIWFEQPVVFGQPANILVMYFGFVGSAIFWVVLKSRQKAKGLFLGFLIAFGLLWLINLALYRFHGDAFNYTALLTLPFLFMVGFKMPSARDAWSALNAFAWSVTAIILFILLIEVLGLREPKPQDPNVVIFDEARYWLPVNGALGIEGRWTGPFGHNGDTAMMGAILVVVAVANWRRSSWIFLSTGMLVLLVTFGRASIGAAAVGVLVVAMFTKTGPLSSVTRSIRVGVGLCFMLGLGVFLVSRPAGVTGRDRFWTAFIDLWSTSPVFGVGGSGIAVSGGLTQQWGHAHNMYINELVRYGVAGLAAVSLLLIFALIATVNAAKLGTAGPLALLITYLVAAMTEPRNNWVEPSSITVLVILIVAAAVGARTNEVGLLKDAWSK